MITGLIQFLKNVTSINAFNHAMAVYGSGKDPMLARSLFLELLSSGPNISEILICLSACEAMLDPRSKRIDQWIAMAREEGALPARLLHAQYNVAMRRGEFQLAYEYIEELTKLDPNPDYLELLVVALGHTNPSEAESVARTFVAKYPRHPGGYFGLAVAAESRNDFVEYAKQMQNAEVCDPSRSDIQFTLAQALCANENYGDAVKHYQRALLMNYEPVVEVLTGLAICALRGDGNARLAKKFCKRALKIDPTHGECTSLLNECIHCSRK